MSAQAHATRFALINKTKSPISFPRKAPLSSLKIRKTPPLIHRPGQTCKPRQSATDPARRVRMAVSHTFETIALVKVV